MNFLDLPDEIVEYILSKLSIVSRHKIRSVNKLFNFLIKYKSLKYFVNGKNEDYTDYDIEEEDILKKIKKLIEKKVISKNYNYSMETDRLTPFNWQIVMLISDQNKVIFLHYDWQINHKQIYTFNQKVLYTFITNYLAVMIFQDGSRILYNNNVFDDARAYSCATHKLRNGPILSSKSTILYENEGYILEEIDCFLHFYYIDEECACTIFVKDMRDADDSTISPNIKDFKNRDIIEKNNFFGTELESLIYSNENNVENILNFCKKFSENFMKQN